MHVLLTPLPCPRSTHPHPQPASCTPHTPPPSRSQIKAWVRYAKFEMKHSNVALARGCYERALEALGEDANTVRRRRGRR